MKRVVAVGMFDSIHFARWLERFQGENLEFFLFPSGPHRQIHPKLLKLSNATSEASFYLPKHQRWLGLPAWLIDRLLGPTVRHRVLRNLIDRVRPNYIHALEMQNAGYLVLETLRDDDKFDGKLVVTNYGSDIYWFQKSTKHREKLSALLGIADKYYAECDRDIELAQQLGFSGDVTPALPNSFVFDEEIQAIELGGQRRVIAVKGYHGWAGRAIPAIRALADISDSLKGYQIIVYSSNLITVFECLRQRVMGRIAPQFFRKGKLPHSQLLQIFAHSSIHVGLSRTDGLSTGTLEAVALGAIPVQSSSSCISEVIGKRGVNVETLERDEIASALLLGLAKAQDLDSPKQMRSLLLQLFSPPRISKHALKAYDIDRD